MEDKTSQDIVSKLLWTFVGLLITVILTLFSRAVNNIQKEIDNNKRSISLQLDKFQELRESNIKTINRIDAIERSLAKIEHVIYSNKDRWQDSQLDGYK